MSSLPEARATEVEPARGGRGLVPLACAMGALVLLAFVAHRAILDCALVGHDSLPLLESSSGGLLALFGQRYLGEWLSQDFYRPGMQLLAALEWRAHGLEPRGYQVLNLGCHLFAALALLVCARMLLGARALLVASVVSALFLLHPLLSESLPVLARRHDALTTGLMCCVLAMVGRIAQAQRRATGWEWALLFALGLAATSIKESAFLLPPLATLAALVCSARWSWRRALALSAPLWLACALLVAARFWVLGSFGGNREAGLGELWGNLWPCARRLVVPSHSFARSALAQPLSAALVGGLCAGALACRGKERGVLLLGLTWCAGSLLLNAYVGVNRPWQALPALVALGLAQCAALQALVRRRELASLACAALLIAPSCWALAWSPLLRGHEQWLRASARAEEFFEETGQRVERARRSQLVRAAHVPLTGSTSAGALKPGQLEKAAILDRRSVTAWLALRFPERPLRVVGARPDVDPEPGPAEILVVLPSYRGGPDGEG